MNRGGRLLALTLLAASVVVLAGHLLGWAELDRRSIGRSDLSATYVGATLWSEGHRGDLYDLRLQAELHDRLIAPDREGNLPFTFPPTAAALAAPLTRLDLVAAFRVFSLLQLGLLGLAVMLAAGTAPGPPPSALWRWAGPALALAAVPVAVLLELGQWDGLAALGVALAGACWSRGRVALGAVALVLLPGLAKPHLAIGLGVVLLGWRERRALLGLGLGLALLLLSWLVTAGGAGVAGFVRLALNGSGHPQPAASQLDWSGLLSSWSGARAPGAMAGVLTLASLLLCLTLGRLARRRRVEPGALLGVGVVLSLLASPHLQMHDLVLLCAALPWALGWARAHDAGGGEPPGRRVAWVLLAWLAVNLAALLDLGRQGGPPGRLVPLVLLSLGLAGLASLARQAPPELRPG